MPHVAASDLVTPRVAASDLVLHCLPMSHKKDARLIILRAYMLLSNLRRWFSAVVHSFCIVSLSVCGSLCLVNVFLTCKTLCLFWFTIIPLGKKAGCLTLLTSILSQCMGFPPMWIFDMCRLR